MAFIITTLQERQKTFFLPFHQDPAAMDHGTALTQSSHENISRTPVDGGRSAEQSSKTNQRTLVPDYRPTRSRSSRTSLMILNSPLSQLVREPNRQALRREAEEMGVSRGCINRWTKSALCGDYRCALLGLGRDVPFNEKRVDGGSLEVSFAI